MQSQHFQDYVQVIMRRRWVIIMFFIFVVVAVLIGSLKQTPIYEATTTLLIDRRSPQVISVQEVAPLGPVEGDHYSQKDYYETQYKLIRSPFLLKKVADSLGWKTDNPDKERDIIKNLLKVVKVRPVRNTQLVEIGVEDSNPEMAVRTANMLADEYIRQNLERNTSASSNAAEWLSKKIDEQRQKLKESEAALQKYREAHSVNILPQTTGEDTNKDVKVEYAHLQALLANYSQRYTDEHPKLIELKAQINSLRNKIQGLEDIDKGTKIMEYRFLEREVETNKHMYEILIERLKEIDLSSNLNVNNISIIERAVTPENPIKPRVPLNMVLAVMLGLLGGGGLGFFVEYLDTTIKSPIDIKNIMESHCLGSIPSIEEKDKIKKDKIVHLQPRTPISEIYREIRTEILYLTPKDKNLAILITSAEPKAGKTMISTNFAITLAQNGNKVLLVDCDLRKPQIHNVFQVDKRPGLSEYLLRNIDLDSIADIKDTKIENLKVVTSGEIPNNPAEIISSSRMMEFILEAKEKFDFVIFDSPPVASVTDAVILADLVDATIQVVRSGTAPVQIVLRAKEKLTSTRTKIFGVILNDLKTYNSDYYYYKYYRYYGKEVKT